MFSLRVNDECIFMLLGEMIEHKRTEDLFFNPANCRKTLRTTAIGEGRRPAQDSMM